MLRKETIEAYLPDHDPEDLQRAVNTYHSFRHGTYNGYDKNSRCSLFDYIERVRFNRKYN